MSCQTTLTKSDDSDESTLDQAKTSKLKYARDYYLSTSFDESSILDRHDLPNGLVDRLFADFSNFKTTNNFLVLRQNNGYSDGQQFAIKLSKRGNSVYRQKKRERIFSLIDGLECSDQDLNFSDQDSTSALMCTLTYDQKRCTIREAWSNIAEEYNQAITSLRQKFGEVSAFRIFEGYQNGYPHIHVIFLFEDQEFTTFQKNGKIRISEKGQISEALNWHSFVDVEGVQHISKSIHYLAKYFVKDSLEVSDSPEDVRKAKVTLALNWLFKRRSFAISGTFEEALHDLIHNLSNSNKVINFNRLFRWLEGVEFEFVTTFSGDLLDFDESETFIVLSTEQIAKIDLSD